MKLSYVSCELRKPAPLDQDWWVTESYPLDHVLLKMSELGLKDVELSGPHIKPRMSTREIGRVKESLKTHNIRIACVDSEAFLWTIKNSDLKEALMFIDVAHKLEADLVKIFSGPAKAAKRTRAMALLGKCAKYAEKSGVTIGVENIWYHHFGKVEAMKEGVEEIGSEALTALIDFSNFYVGGEDSIEAAKLFGGKLVHAHVKDVVTSAGREDWKVLGRGDLSRLGLFPKIIDELKRADYGACLSLEPHVAPSLDALEESIAYIRPLIG